MDFRITFLLLSIALTSCTKNENKTIDQEPLKIDTTRVSIIKYNLANPECKYIFENVTNAELTNTDLKKIEDALDKIILKQNPLQIERFEEVSTAFPNENYKKEDFLIKKEEYIRRYLVVNNQKGQKEVYIALACDSIAKDFNLKNRLMQGHGGGSCLFSFKLNLDTRKYYDVYFNAEA